MDRKTYEQQKAFAGECKPSMHRRCLDHDYTGRCIYMLTLVTEGRRPLFGQLEGRSDAVPGSEDQPRVVLSELGQEVHRNFYDIEKRHPEIRVVALQMMPDHLHGILFVEKKWTSTWDRPSRVSKQAATSPTAASSSGKTSRLLWHCHNKHNSNGRLDRPTTATTGCSLRAVITTVSSCRQGNWNDGSITWPTTQDGCWLSGNIPICSRCILG